MIKDLCFEIIQTCPNNCLFCSSCSGEDKTKIISYETLKNTIDYLIDNYGIEEISISGGEPFLHPELDRILYYCKSKNIRTVLFTSGIKRRKKYSKEELELHKKDLINRYKSFMDEGISSSEFDLFISNQMNIINGYNSKCYSGITIDDFRLLENIGVDKIVFDIQGWNKDVYNKIMGTKEYYELVISTLAIASSTSLETDVHFIPTKINYKELPDLIEMLNYANFNQLSILNFVPQGRGSANKYELMLSNDEFNEFVSIYENEKDKFNGNIRVGIPYLTSDEHLCTAGLSKLVIKYDGTVLPCPAFKEFDISILNKLGIKTPNIYDDLSEIIIREGKMQKPLCKRLYNFNRNIR